VARQNRQDSGCEARLDLVDIRARLNQLRNLGCEPNRHFETPHAGRARTEDQTCAHLPLVLSAIIKSASPIHSEPKVSRSWRGRSRENTDRAHQGKGSRYGPQAQRCGRRPAGPTRDVPHRGGGKCWEMRDTQRDRTLCLVSAARKDGFGYRPRFAFLKGLRRPGRHV
jgi:hypothetical protein